MYCILDTETVGGATKPTGFYHLGGVICDRNGNIVGCFNYLIAEMLDLIEFDEYAKKNMNLYLHAQGKQQQNSIKKVTL